MCERDAADGEAAIAEQRHVEHRVVAAHLPVGEQVAIAVPAAKLTTDEVEVQPRSGAWMMAYTRVLIAAMDRTAPIGSSRVT